MSNELAIAAVTTTLRNLLTQGIQDALGSGAVTTRPPDRARENGDSTNQINLFLYQTHVNSHWRNLNVPSRVKPGETGRSPLPLNLYYLVTAYGQDDDDVEGHRLLGGAMRILHDNTVLQPEAIRAALAESDLHNQVERVRISPLQMSLDEISKLWTTFQTQYRISTAYEVTVVLIDSAAPARTPLPVLTRGNEDRGVRVQANTLPPCPTLTGIALPNQQVSAQLGDRLVLQGYALDADGDAVTVRLRHPRIEEPLTVDGTVQSGGRAIAFTLPNAPEPWLAGFYTLMVQLQQEGREETSNTVALAIAPRITEMTQDISDEGDPVLRMACRPQVQLTQPVFCLVGSRSLPLMRVAGDADQDRRSALTFDLGGIAPGDYWVRLRVDGVDSLLIDRSTAPPRFDERWRLTLS
ncbi:MAG: DUF4255 domain-containing protein [Elainellaceae cyanobacterium]